jgi:hypothetical protein
MLTRIFNFLSIFIWNLSSRIQFTFAEPKFLIISFVSEMYLESVSRYKALALLKSGNDFYDNFILGFGRQDVEFPTCKALAVGLNSWQFHALTVQHAKN